MARISPLLPQHIASGATLLAYGPPGAGIQVVESFAPFGLEYAALRTSAALLDAPFRGLIRIGGADRAAFLQRMVTGDLRNLAPWESRCAFWLNRKGRIDADLLALEVPAGPQGPQAAQHATLLELDAHSVRNTVETLGAFVIADDVLIEDLTDTTHQLQLHGSAALAMLSAHSEHVAGPPVTDLQAGQACSVRVHTPVGPAPVLVIRHDPTGDPGLLLITSVSDAAAVYEALSELPVLPTTEGAALESQATTDPRRARRIGWHAFNVARIEAGTPLFNLDFGGTSLPHETGDEVLKTRVSFTKGCYLGQEVVARMNALGHPSKKLVAFDLDLPAASGAPQPVTGSLIFASPDDSKPPIGAITSSAVSPMLGGRAICFGMVKFAHSAPASQVFVQPSPETAMVPAKVRETLAFWNRPLATPAPAHASRS